MTITTKELRLIKKKTTYFGSQWGIEDPETKEHLL